jgi:transmembrane sensor
MSNRETAAAIDQAAANWVARRDGGAMSEADQARFDAWLAADLRHLGAYAKALAVFRHTDRLQALGHGEALRASEPTNTKAIWQKPLNRRGLLAAGMGSLTLGLGGAGWLAAITFSRAKIATEKGEVRRLALPDGSSVTLNTASIVRVSYSANVRRVHLLDGEALFDVAKDPARPFVVFAGDSQVRAVGTSFTVRRLTGGAVRVMVREGVVEVRQAGGAAPVKLAANALALAPAPMAQGPEAMIHTAYVAPTEIARQLTWREGLLSFDGVSLYEASAEFARYSDTRIIIDDPVIGRKTITGLFSANDPKGFAKAAATSLGLTAQAQGEQVHLSY